MITCYVQTQRLPNPIQGGEIPEVSYDTRYGEVRLELYPEGMVVHPKLFRCTKSTIEYTRKELYNIIWPIIEEKGYTFILFHTDNEKFVKRLTLGKYTEWLGYNDGSHRVFYTTKEEIKEIRKWI